MDELVALERRFWTEASGALYRERAADDLVMVFPEPFGVVGRDEAIPAVDETGPWDDVDLQHVRVLELTPDCTALIYRAVGVRAGETYRTLAASVYARRDDRWALVLHQQTPSADR